MASEHTAKAFDSDLQELTRLVAEMGGLAEKMVIDAVDALASGDAALAQQVVETDPRLDTLQREIEELIQELAEDYTIAIVTHNMQQAARVSNKTAFMYLGELIEFDETNRIFTSPSDRRTQDYITGRFG